MAETLYTTGNPAQGGGSAGASRGRGRRGGGASDGGRGGGQRAEHH